MVGMTRDRALSERLCEKQEEVKVFFNLSSTAVPQTEPFPTPHQLQKYYR